MGVPSAAPILNGVRFLLRDWGDTTSVYLVDHDQARVWNPSARRWVPSGIDWTGIGGATEYDPATVEEASRVLLDLGVLPADLPKALRGV